MPKVFISYRRSDSGTIAGRINDRLVAAFGQSNIFKDSHSIGPGDDFRGRIRDGVGQCDVVLIIIGATWLIVTEKTDPTKRRLDNPNDWVRIEVETALQRSANGAARVIPVLVQGASIPAEVDLPTPLKELAFRNAVPIRDDPDFETDIKRLIDSLRPAPATSVQPPATRPSLLRRANLIWIIAPVVVILVLLSVLLNNNSNTTNFAATQTSVALAFSSTPASTDTPIVTSTEKVIETKAAIVNPTDTELVSEPTVDGQATANAALLIENTSIAATARAIPTNTSIPTVAPSNTPVPPTDIPAPTLQSTLVAPAADTVQLELSTDKDTLTLYVSQQVSLLGLQLVVVNNGNQEVYPIEQTFPVLQLNNYVAEASSCFVYRLADSSSPPPNKCQADRLFRQELARADIFWYDSVTIDLRDVVVDNLGKPVALCLAANPACTINWPKDSSAATAASMSLTATNPVQGYPCPATVKNNDASQVTILKIVRSEPLYAASPTVSVRLGQTVLVMKKELEGSRTVWYLITDDQQHELGYVLEDYLDLSPACPA